MAPYRNGPGTAWKAIRVGEHQIMMSRAEFTSKLYSSKIDNCFNPYLDTCPVFDRPDAVEIRRKNLEILLDAVERHDAIDLWVGRDLGYRGGRRTGLALADELSLEFFGSKAGATGLRKSTIGPAQKERTATVVRQALEMTDVPVLTWNVFPFHPYASGKPFSNRMHNKKEYIIGVEFLRFLCNQNNIRYVVGVGNDAYTCLQSLLSKAMRTRHPSYGGQAEFLHQIQTIYPPRVELPRVQGELNF